MFSPFPSNWPLWEFTRDEGMTEKEGETVLFSVKAHSRLLSYCPKEFSKRKEDGVGFLGRRIVRLLQGA